MISELNKNIVNDTFNNVYSEEQFTKFIKDLLPSANYSEEKVGYFQIPNDYKDFIRSTKRICKYKYTSEEYVDDKVIDVLVVKLKRTSSIERARVAQRNYIARHLDKGRGDLRDAALVAFISEDENGNIAPDWRFSFVQMNWESKIVDGKNGKKRITEKQLTPAKRFSFLVGENEDTHTAQKQLATCLEKSSKGEKITIEDLVQAFDIEKVSKEFFEKYKTLYLKLRDELKRLCNEDKIVNEDFVEHNINVDDFAKKTLGQLVFLYFIQKKGWLGVPKDKDWGAGDKKFLRNVFDKKYCQYDNFFNDILEHLFYEALAYDRGYNNFEFEKLNCRIPFLNGGLFEPVNGYEYQKTDLTIHNDIFKEIFDTFDLYNFTVKEDEPLEKEVAIDPEMLGKVFENLLPENERKGNGAFYTPREIVHYMCQESLINYLYNKVNIKEVPLSQEQKDEQLKLLKTKKEKEQLKLTHEVIEEIIPKEDIEFLVKTGNSTYINKTRGINVTLPDSIKQNAKPLDKTLSDIKVCDPAIGSGAFPVGMMNEIVRARATLSEYIGKPNRSMYELKRNAIENSIYGVDIDGGAVDIAKLRFWLSLVVDEEDIKNIKPLPNLDYKIMQGNSLITSYEGIDFDEIVAKQKKVKQLDLFSSASEKITDIISSKQNEFLNTPYPTRKIEIKQEIEDLIVELVKTKFEEKAEKEGPSKNFYEETIRHFAQNKENRNFFPWKLFFADAFEKGGFDVVIGNPPYVSAVEHSKDNETERELYRSKYKLLKGAYDLYTVFLLKGVEITNKKGVYSWIIPNKFLVSNYAENTLSHLKNNGLFMVIDVSTFNVFKTASVYPIILVANKNKQTYDEYKINEIQDLTISNLTRTNNVKSYKTFADYGIKIGSGTTGFQAKLIVKDITTQKNDTNIPFIVSGSIDRYYINYNNVRYMGTTYPQAYISQGKDIANSKWEFWNNEKIVIAGMTKVIEATFSNTPLALGVGSYAIYDYNGFNKFYLLGILNSNFLTWYINTKFKDKHLAGGYLAINKSVIEKLPLVKPNNKVCQNIEECVCRILKYTNSEDYSENIEKQQAVKEYEQQIDIMVYKLYDLTYSEVKTIDPNFSISEQDYNKYEL